jgi:hypothetical protein
MSAVAVREGYTNTLRVFGEVDTLVNEAVERYLIQRVVERIKLAREKAREFEKRYGLDYQTFSRRVQLDEGFYDQVSAGNPLWEQDWLAWEYWHRNESDV